MLRYDACFPAREQDSYRIRDRSDTRHVIVARWVGQPGSWTEGRWRSFTWTLLDTYNSEYTAAAYIEAEEKAHAKAGGK